MKWNKKTFFRVHGWIGTKLSILFFIVCFSGTLATLSREMDWLFFPEIRAKYEGVYASHNKMFANIKKAYPEGRITYFSASNEPYLCNIVYINVQKQLHYVFVNPYTGEVQGSATLTFQRFFRDLHYYLFIPFQIGHFTVLIFGFMLFISLMTGLLFYKNWWRKLFDLKIGKGKVAFYKSLHRLMGAWSVPFAILFSITGIWYFVERTNIGGVSKIANTRAPKIEKVDIDSLALSSLSYTIDYDRAVKVAKKVIPDLKVKDIVPPRNEHSALYINGISHVPLVRNRANRIYIHPTSYALIQVQKAEDIPVVTWLNDIADPLHFGYWGGLVTKIIWFIAGMIISALVLTGIWIALKRQKKNRRIKKKGLGIWKYINWAMVLVMIGFMITVLKLRYAASLRMIVIINIAFIILIFLTWYIFVYRLNKSILK